jgi:hypothetical protein
MDTAVRQALDGVSPSAVSRQFNVIHKVLEELGLWQDHRVLDGYNETFNTLKKPRLPARAQLWTWTVLPLFWTRLPDDDGVSDRQSGTTCRPTTLNFVFLNLAR